MHFRLPKFVLKRYNRKLKAIKNTIDEKLYLSTIKDYFSEWKEKNMKRFQLIWYNYVAQEECVDYILAKDENDAREIAYMWIRRWVGHDDNFAESAIESLYEYDEIDDITREQMEEYWQSKIN